MIFVLASYYVSNGVGGSGGGTRLMRPSYVLMYEQDVWTQCSPETLPHKAVGASE